MRLFIGINLPKDLKDTLASYTNQFDEGQPVAKDNTHITLVYLGETTETKKATIDQALKTLIPTWSPFTVSLSSLKSFKKGTNHIVYVEVIKTDPLDSLYQALHSLMSSLGYSLDSRPYTPHITLARKVKRPPQNVHVNTTFTVSEVTLFLSHRVAGDLTYTPIETYPLKSAKDTPTKL
ncbi:MAG: RNA 2',3'-cyclic phosphodiesterase [Bacillota bacterium]